MYESIGQITNQTNKKIIYFLNSKLEVFDITLEQWNVLLKLSQENKINQKQLAHKVDKDEPTLARILNILERKGLVVRQPSKEDKRAFCLNLTDKGVSLKKKIEPFFGSLFEIIISGVAIEEIEIYKRVLMKINNNINIKHVGKK
ncbi:MULTISPECIES: MarR family transcriptional regulator [Clostridium]|uniref:MarR family transcriptional regulator n=1 Tax=Clostridium cibarium TaxID=2762247 RepID=A0ABR8PWF2_9CLOT|nr:MULTISPECIES: MarR family transcriptional regulator [Clostridium]MBD7912512.1 MarR family transcriptional regulator [Clostridium cibarium]